MHIDPVKFIKSDLVSAIANFPSQAEFPLNDYGNALRLKALFGNDLMYVRQRGWAAWDGSKYCLTTGRLTAEKAAVQLAKLVTEEAERARKNGGLRLCHELLKYAERCGNMTKRRAALEALAIELAVQFSDLNSAPQLFSVANGTIDLHSFAAHSGFPAQRKRTIEVMDSWAKEFFGPSERYHRPTKASQVAYIPTAKCKNWRAFIRLIFPDKDIQECVQRTLGAMLYGSNESQVMVLFRGSGGNGKSTLLNVIGQVLGDYAAPCPVLLFLRGPMQNAGRATPEEMGMPAARMILASEPGISGTLSGKSIKAFTGGGRRMARALHKDPFEYTPSAIPVLQFNRTPRIVEEDEGLRRRLLFIPFDIELHNLPEASRHAPEKVADLFKNELPGILNWLLAGYKEYARRKTHGKGQPLGIDPPPVLLALKDQLLLHSDPVGNFLKANTEPRAGADIWLSELCASVNVWSSNNGSTASSIKSTARLLREKGYSTRISSGSTLVCGIGWISGSSRSD